MTCKEWDDRVVELRALLASAETEREVMVLVTLRKDKRIMQLEDLTRELAEENADLVRAIHDC